MSTYTLHDHVAGIKGHNKVTMTDASIDIPVTVKLHLQQETLGDFTLDIETIGIESLATLGRLLVGTGFKLIADQDKYEEEHHPEPPC